MFPQKEKMSDLCISKERIRKTEKVAAFGTSVGCAQFYQWAFLELSVMGGGGGA